MAEEKAQTDTEKKQRSRIYLQLISSFVVNLTMYSAGLCYGWVTVSLPKLHDSKSEITLSGDQGGWIASGINIGACLGPVTSSLLLDQIGRKWSLYITAIPFIASWILTYLAHSWILLFVGKLIAGLSIGAVFNMIPTYLGELVEKRIRGAASAMIGLFLNLGQTTMYAVGPVVDAKILALIGLVPSVVFFLLLPWIPESPYYYLKKNREKSAELALVWLRRKTDNADEIKQMKQLIEDEKGGGVMDVFKRANRKPLWILLLLLTGQQFSGYLGVQSYSMELFKSMHLTFSENTALLIMSGVSLVLSMLAAVTVDKLGRKPVFLIASYISSLCLFTMGGYLVAQKSGMKIDHLSYIPFAANMIYIAAFSFGLSHVPAIISGEIFPLNVKPYAIMIVNVYGSILGLIVVKCYQLVADAVGVYSVLLAFGVIELTIAIAASIIMPETARKSFAEIQAILKTNVPTSQDANNLKQDESPTQEESETQ